MGATYWTAPERPPWKGEAQGQRWESPRRRPRSPRARAKDASQVKGGGKGQPPGKGKAKTGAVSQTTAAPVAPKSSALPPAPTPPATVLPKPTTATQATSATAGGPDKKLLEALLSHVGERDDLPPDLVGMMEKYKNEDGRAQHRELHRVVTRKAEAHREITRIQQERATYCAGWAAYMNDLLALVETQLQERDVVLGDLDVAEDQWQSRLREASSSLAKHANVKEPVIDLDGDEAIEASEAVVVEVIEDENKRLAARRAKREQTAAQTDKVMSALKAAKEATQEGREASRTPRRKRGAGEIEGHDVEQDEERTMEGLPLPKDGSAPPGEARG